MGSQIVGWEDEDVSLPGLDVQISVGEVHFSTLRIDQMHCCADRVAGGDLVLPNDVVAIAPGVADILILMKTQEGSRFVNEDVATVSPPQGRNDRGVLLDVLQYSVVTGTVTCCPEFRSEVQVVVWVNTNWLLEDVFFYGVNNPTTFVDCVVSRELILNI